MRTLACATVMLFVSVATQAQNQTPSSKQAFLFQPYVFGLGNGGGACYTAAIGQGYVVTQYEQNFPSTTPSVGVFQMFGGLAAGHGIFLIASHASLNGIAIEAYENTPNGLAARDNDFNFYLASGYAGKLYKGTSAHGHHIGAFPAAIGSSYVSANSIVHVVACEAHSWRSTAWPVSRCQLGYSMNCLPANGGAEASQFWSAMGGDIYNRTVTNAKGALSLEMDGDGATTLTPWVSYFSHSSGTNIPGTLNIYWDFDTATNQAANPIGTSGIVQLVSYTWNSSTKLSATVQSIGIGDGLVTAKASVIASANTNQLLLHGGQDHSVRLIHSNNPAADVHGITYRDGAVRFDVGSEPDAGPGATDHYDIEASNGAAGPWSVVASVPGGAGIKTASVGDPRPFVRVVEVEKDGDRLTHGSARADAVADVSLTPSLAEHARREEYERLKATSSTPTRFRGAALAGETVVAYTTPALVSVVQSEIASFWSSWGATIDVVSTGGFPADAAAFRAALKADIDTRVASGADAVLLVGDANDHRQFTGTEYQSLWLPENGWEAIRQSYLSGGYVDQSNRDGIPTFYSPDVDPRGVNMGYVTPYWMSDWPYVDVDDDGLPDVPVTRLPFTTTDEVYAYAGKLFATQSGDFGAHAIGLFAGDGDNLGAEGDDVLATMSTIAGVAVGLQLEWLYESAYPSVVQRNAAAADIWNTANPEIVFILGTLSNRSNPGGFFDQTVSPPFTMDFLQSHAGLVVALSCGGANFAQTEDSDYGRPVGERFLAEWSKGAIAWVGPTVGTWQHANDELSIAFAEELFADFSRPIASSYLVALRRVLTEHAGDAEVIRSVMSTTVLGDPLVRVNEAPIATAIGDDRPAPRAFSLAQNVPNPFNPVTHIVFSVPERSLVRLRIYDVQGRLVATLADRSFPAGSHSLSWDGKDDRGQDVASGLYFYRLSAGDRSASRKMVLLK